jgi:hypothetical protein
MASSRNLSTYNLSLKEQQYLARRGYESIATRDWGPPGLRAGAGRGSISMRARRVREARGRRDETTREPGSETETCAASGALVGRRAWLGLEIQA